MRRYSLALVGLLLLLGQNRAHAQFSLSRYEPTVAGQSTFMIDRPWYSKQRLFAVGLTLDYAHDPLVVAPAPGFTGPTDVVIRHQLIGSLDAAFSAFDRVNISFSIPLTMLERGAPADGIGPISGAQVGDPRLGAMFRLYGHADDDHFSLHLGGYLWVPVGTHSDHQGDVDARGLFRLVGAGMIVPHFRYTLNVGVLLRGRSAIGDQNQYRVGDELQLGGELGFVGDKGRLTIGPEVNVSTLIINSDAFKKSETTVEIALLSVNYRIVDQVLVGAAWGLGALREPGTPDWRVLFHVAYAPTRKPHPRHEPVELACPPAPVAVPVGDNDGDGIPNDKDVCPDQSAWPSPDASAARRGCPAGDSDHDGVADPDDLCPNEPAGDHPDPNRKGCPVGDRDKDGVLDDVDACPDRAGEPSSDPAKNGCPRLVELKDDKIEILRPVFFSTDSEVILPESDEVLTAVAEILKAQPNLTKVAVEGHTDDTGKAAHNLDLSKRRAHSVLKWLTDHGVAAARLESHGYGSTRPVNKEKTAEARLANRRVEFRIVEKK